ncbi:NUDIX hydrolase [Shimia sp. SDUM112013]|uniref:NUDIX hydrolase n=1 Tax=Shimia sp. SDUM112013 TaxID=3136160 RepID=UPI0032EF5786
MTLHIMKPRPIMMQSARKTDLRTQFGALVYRIQNGKTQILLITSRKTRRWIIPKGWPMSGLTPAQAAAREAWEEAGVKGITHDIAIGSFSYSKKIKTRGGVMPMPVMTIVYPVQARKLSAKFPEEGQRRRKWFSPKKAALKVREPELAYLLRNFDARHLR